LCSHHWSFLFLSSKYLWTIAIDPFELVSFCLVPRYSSQLTTYNFNHFLRRNVLTSQNFSHITIKIPRPSLFLILILITHNHNVITFTYNFNHNHFLRRNVLTSQHITINISLRLGHLGSFLPAKLFLRNLLLLPNKQIFWIIGKPIVYHLSCIRGSQSTNNKEGKEGTILLS
jgi:hypothetical protein